MNYRHTLFFCVCFFLLTFSAKCSTTYYFIYHIHNYINQINRWYSSSIVQTLKCFKVSSLCWRKSAWSQYVKAIDAVLRLPNKNIQFMGVLIRFLSLSSYSSDYRYTWTFSWFLSTYSGNENYASRLAWRPETITPLFFTIKILENDVPHLTQYCYKIKLYG